MPDIEYAFLADAADVQPGSKFHVLGGGITRLNAPSFPFVHPHLAIMVGLRITSVERNREYDMGFIVTGPDGGEVATASGKVTSRGPLDASDTILTISVDLWNLQLRSAGEHSIRIIVDGSERKRLPLFVARVPRPAAPETPRYLA